MVWTAGGVVSAVEIGQCSGDWSMQWREASAEGRVVSHGSGESGQLTGVVRAVGSG